jgi:hypothetical protein
MHHPPSPTDIGTVLIGSWFAFAFLSYLVLVFVMPLCAVILTLNIRRIRKELQQLNETLSLPSRRL